MQISFTLALLVTISQHPQYPGDHHAALAPSTEPCKNFTVSRELIQNWEQETLVGVVCGGVSVGLKALSWNFKNPVHPALLHLSHE
jgi:hypothetical protein